jgi:hypothetical protein
MNLVAPEILQEARGLPPLVTGSALAIGFVLWLWGARGHRFWIALAITAAAGLVGLFHGPTYGLQPLVAGLLLAVAAGTLALSLVRVLLFVAGGFAALALVQSVAPAWNEPIVSFLVGGLAGIVLYRVWIIALTSLIGTLLMVYGGLCLCDGARGFDAAAWAAKNGPLASWACGALAVLGVLMQFLGERRRKRKAAPPAEAPEEPAWNPPKPQPKPRSRPKVSAWWEWVQKHALRRAG